MRFRVPLKQTATAQPGGQVTLSTRRAGQRTAVPMLVLTFALVLAAPLIVVIPLALGFPLGGDVAKVAMLISLIGPIASMTILEPLVGEAQMRLSTRRMLEGLWFVGPWVSGFLLFMAWPLLQSAYLSFHELQATSLQDLKFRGIDNFKEAFLIDARFTPNLLNTLNRNLADIPIIMVFSLFAALLANQKIKGVIGFRAVFFLPLVIASNQVIQQLNAQGVGGLALSQGLDYQEWLVTYLGPDQSQGVINVLNRITFVLWNTGVQMLIFLAGLNGVSYVLYEAGKVDGTTDWDKFWKITLPLLTPVILVNLIYTIINSFTDPFNQVLSYIQQVAFAGGFRLGYAAALGWVYFLIVFAVLVVVIGVANRFVFYSGEREGR